MNRKERRAARKATPAYLRETREEITKRLIKNGITENDLRKEYENGYSDGFKQSAAPIIKSCFAATCLALNELHGFGAKRCAVVLNEVDRHMTESLSSAEAIDEVYKRMGLELDFKEPFERIREL